MKYTAFKKNFLALTVVVIFSAPYLYAAHIDLPADPKAGADKFSQFDGKLNKNLKLKKKVVTNEGEATLKNKKGEVGKHGGNYSDEYGYGYYTQDYTEKDFLADKIFTDIDTSLNKIDFAKILLTSRDSGALFYNIEASVYMLEEAIMCLNQVKYDVSGISFGLPFVIPLPKIESAIRSIETSLALMNRSAGRSFAKAEIVWNIDKAKQSILQSNIFRMVMNGASDEVVFENILNKISFATSIRDKELVGQIVNIIKDRISVSYKISYMRVVGFGHGSRSSELTYNFGKFEIDFGSFLYGSRNTVGDLINKASRAYAYGDAMAGRQILKQLEVFFNSLLSGNFYGSPYLGGGYSDGGSGHGGDYNGGYPSAPSAPYEGPMKPGKKPLKIPR